ncbi:hypothetical protein BGW39_002701 [Mortierella sp. 14UC]|nr:hypothetical protein BGW39_002701 [Mortierella sp. 14UC]
MLFIVAAFVLALLSTASDAQTTVAVINAPSSKIFLDGFIKTHNFETGGSGPTKWVQVTGSIRRKKYCLSSGDQGAQNDPSHPSGATCAGYPHFVQLVEPNENIYCIRCCRNKDDCPTDRDTEGCKAIFPGAKYD